MIRYNPKYWEDVNRVLEIVPNLNEIKGSSVLITGGTGMVCSSVVDLLFGFNQFYQGNIKIFLGGRNRERVYKRFPHLQNEKNFHFINYDAIIDQELDCCVDYIIHGAANANPTIYTEEPVETILANLVGLNSLLKTARNKKSKRLLYISSSEVYGTREENRPYDEDDYGFVDILKRRAGYPCSKRAAEALCIAYMQEYGVDSVIARPGHIYGPSITDTDSRASAQFTRNAVHGENIVMKSPGEQLRSYCYTLDCASAILTVLLNGERGNAYNISNRDSVVSVRDVAEAFANAAGTHVVLENPTELEKQGYNLMTNSSLNAEKLEKLGWKAIFDLQGGSKRTIEFYE